MDAGSGDEIPIRDLVTSGAGWLPVQTPSPHNQYLVLLDTGGDGPQS